MSNDEQIIEAYKQIIKSQGEVIDALTELVKELSNKTSYTTISHLRPTVQTYFGDKL